MIQCKYEFKVDNSLGGQKADCTWCGKPFVVPEAYAEGAKTDDAVDPKVVRRQQEQERGDVDIRMPGSSYDPVSEVGGSNWPIYIAIIVLINLILIPLSGYALIPR